MHVVVPVIPSEDEEAQKGEGGSGDAAHLTATKATTARGGWPPAVAILRLSVHRRGLGAMHVVLESMHCDPPYLLENRTRFPLQYRQVGGRWHTQHPAGCLPDGTRDCREQRLPTIQLRDCLSSARLPFCRPMCGLRPSTLSNPSAQVLCCAVLPLPHSLQYLACLCPLTLFLQGAVSLDEVAEFVSSGGVSRVELTRDEVQSVRRY